MSDINNSYINEVRQIVRRSENPHPLTIIIIAVFSLLFIYYIYEKYLKPSKIGRAHV